MPPRPERLLEIKCSIISYLALDKIIYYKLNVIIARIGSDHVLARVRFKTFKFDSFNFENIPIFSFIKVLNLPNCQSLFSLLWMGPPVWIQRAIRPLTRISADSRVYSRSYQN